MRRATLRSTEHGNSIIEMMLFVPFGLIFVFLVIDAGFALQDRSAVLEGIRSGLAAHPAMVPVAGGAGSANTMVEGVAGEIEAAIGRTRGIGSVKGTKIHVALIELTINEDTGAAEGYSFLVPGRELGTAPPAAKGAVAKSLSEHVDELVAQERLLSPSAFAVPLGRIMQFAQMRTYLPHAYVLVASVRSRARGVSSSVAEGLMGRPFVIDEFQATPLRTPEAPNV